MGNEERSLIHCILYINILICLYIYIHTYIFTNESTLITLTAELLRDRRIIYIHT